MINLICRALTGGMLLVVIFNVGALAQSGGNSRHERKLIFYETFQGSSNALGQVLKLNTKVGYRFNRHFEADVRLPVYLLRTFPASTESTSRGSGATGDTYFDLRAMMGVAGLNYSSTLTVAAPTGDRETGLSTGRATVDWNNHFDRSLGSVTPFAEVGLATSLFDTHVFDRPFTSLGKVAYFEGGLDLDLTPHTFVGGSVYADRPLDEQKVFSKIVIEERPAPPGAPSPPPGKGKGRGRGRGGSNRPPEVFETEIFSVVDPDVLRDHGFNLWMGSSLSPVVFLQLGYSRSIGYDLNTVYFSLSFNIGTLLREHFRP